MKTQRLRCLLPAALVGAIAGCATKSDMEALRRDVVSNRRHVQSDAQDAARHLPRRAEPFAGRRIIAATDFSATCTLALDASLELAETLDARVDCVHVIKLPVPFAISPAEWPEIVGGEGREALEHLHSRNLAELVGEARAARCTPQTILGTTVSGTLRELALELDADLIALPSHSTSDDHPPRFGSTTENVIKRAPVPVLVYPVRFLEQRYGIAADND